ncbi:hypothetical protein CFB46_18430 [Burkholderia sp. HI2761]|uniref:hypothetical protein n=1 Tax=unclassified Burkholderia TaxID=2613784 RepID=UPI000B7A6288|nr:MULTISPECIES: hypothetical protein [unclassified Burkholderia]MPV58954.1 hypothetical protein [Burkholderia sp. BE24]OXJ22930.1 hypothetical protein CFB46_18430 [Burkholderia sp. HI2761]
MSILKICRWPKVGVSWDVITEGTGELKKKPGEKFSVTGVNKDGLRTENTYYVYQGSHSDQGQKVVCKSLSSTGNVAEFQVQAQVFLAEEYGALVQTFQNVLAAATKTVDIGIGKKDFATLKQAGYNLCFAKKVGDADYNIVWRASFEYLEDNEFSWTPIYQIFGTNRYQDGITVKASTKKVAIGLGEIIILDKYGQFGAPSTGGDPTAINMENDYGDIHPGICQLSTGVDGEAVSTPIYVAPDVMVSGEASFTPIEKVLVWFEQNIQTSTIFSKARSRSIEIDLTNTNSTGRVYEGGQWKTP